MNKGLASIILFGALNRHVDPLQIFMHLVQTTRKKCPQIMTPQPAWNVLTVL
jgi:hypothetical protein